MLGSHRRLLRAGALLLLLALVAGLGLSTGAFTGTQPPPRASAEAPMLASAGGAPINPLEI